MADPTTSTVVFTPYKSWFKYDPEQGFVKVGSDDPRVVEAQSLGVPFLIGTDVIANHPEFKRLTEELAELKEKFIELRDQAANLEHELRQKIAEDKNSPLEAEIERLKRVVIEKDTIVSDKSREVSDRDGVIKDRDATIRDLRRQLEDEKSTPRADPAEIDRLRREIASKTTEHRDEIRAKDAEIADLTKERDDLKARPAPTPASAPPVAFYRQWWNDREKRPAQIKLGGLAMVLLAILVFATLGVRHVVWGEHADGTTVVTKTEVPADYDSLKARIADAEAKLTAEERAKKELAERLSKLPPLVPLKPIADPK